MYHMTAHQIVYPVMLVQTSLRCMSQLIFVFHSKLVDMYRLIVLMHTDYAHSIAFCTSKILITGKLLISRIEARSNFKSSLPVQSNLFGVLLLLLLLLLLSSLLPTVYQYHLLFFFHYNLMISMMTIQTLLMPVTKNARMEAPSGDSGGDGKVAGVEGVGGDSDTASHLSSPADANTASFFLANLLAHIVIISIIINITIQLKK
jgi:hypothetical protein